MSEAERATLRQKSVRTSAAVVLVDVQGRLSELQADHPDYVARCRILLAGAGILGVPVIVTEQHPRGLGPTRAELLAVAGAGPVVVEKTAFSCAGEPRFVDALAGLGVRDVVVAGIEAHICVQQTVLDLLAEPARWAAGGEGRVLVAADAVSARRAVDRDVAFARMRDAGAVVTTAESVLFEWLGRAGGPEFKAVQALLK